MNEDPSAARRDLLRAVIVSNGDLPFPEHDRDQLTAGDLIIAADGGLRHCQALGLSPAVLIGDLDSLDEAEIDALDLLQTHIARYPSRKDATDLELALDYAAEMGVDEVLILAGFGGRWDQSLANALLPIHPKTGRLPIRMVSGRQEARWMRGAVEIVLSGQPGDIVSLIPLSEAAHGITTRGLEYPLADETLHVGSTRGVSNTMTGQEAQVKLERGALLCTVIHGEHGHTE